MTWTPPNYTAAPEGGRMNAGIYPNCILADFKEAKNPEKFGATVVFIATYRDTDTNDECVDFIKFGTGRKGGDYYAGLRIERLHTLLDCPLNAQVDCEALLSMAEGATFTVELVDTVSNGKTYTNIQDVRGTDGVSVSGF